MTGRNETPHDASTLRDREKVRLGHGYIGPWAAVFLTVCIPGAIYAAFDGLVDVRVLPDGVRYFRPVRHWPTELWAAVALVFLCPFFGLIWKQSVGGWFYGRRLRRLRAERPDEPWTVRADWAEGVVRPAFNGDAVLVVSLIAVFAAVASAVFGESLYFDAAARRQIVPWLAVLYPVASVVAGGWVLRYLGRHVFKATSRFRMAGDCGVIGGPLSGVVEIDRDVDAPDGFLLELECVATRGVLRRRRGKREVRLVESSVHLEKRVLRDELTPSGDGLTALPVHFAVPFDANATTVGYENPQYAWELTATTAGDGGRLAKFTVPVFRTSASTVDYRHDEGPLRPVSGDDDPFGPLRRAGLHVVSADADRLEIVAPAWRRPVASMVVTAVGLCFLLPPVAALIYWLGPLVADWPENVPVLRAVTVAAVFGWLIAGGFSLLIGLMITCTTVARFVERVRIVADRDGVTREHRRFGWTGTVSTDSGDVRSIDFVRSEKGGRASFGSLHLKTSSSLGLDFGRRPGVVRLASNLSEPVAEALIAEIECRLTGRDPKSGRPAGR